MCDIDRVGSAIPTRSRSCISFEYGPTQLSRPLASTYLGKLEVLCHCAPHHPALAVCYRFSTICVMGRPPAESHASTLVGLMDENPGGMSGRNIHVGAGEDHPSNTAQTVSSLCNISIPFYSVYPPRIPIPRTGRICIHPSPCSSDY